MLSINEKIEFSESFFCKNNEPYNLINMEKRREFIKKSLLGTAGIAMAGMSMSAKSYASNVGANERINIAVVGIRGQGSNHIDQWCALKDNRNVRFKTL